MRLQNAFESLATIEDATMKEVVGNMHAGHWIRPGIHWIYLMI